MMSDVDHQELVSRISPMHKKCLSIGVGIKRRKMILQEVKQRYVKHLLQETTTFGQRMFTYSLFFLEYRSLVVSGELPTYVDNKVTTLLSNQVTQETSTPSITVVFSIMLPLPCLFRSFSRAFHNLLHDSALRCPRQQINFREVYLKQWTIEPIIKENFVVLISWYSRSKSCYYISTYTQVRRYW
ncbi:hypothetical protein JTB14_017316 [Gonioctena quinquepunctata]|nr:hypothetical protein JTB14_017316 [Gonioctena quinquepunctata]